MLLKEDSTISNKIPDIPRSRDRGINTSPAEGPKNDIDRETLETIYTTSLQLNRIMPALTKLLAEPDPLYTLVDGGRSGQGRIEIYNRGRWGTMCHRNLTHPEADTICRHLGFVGGISAGQGYFGDGTGISWSLNTTCLANHECPSVTIGPTCSHNLDAGVICDHMLRIKSEQETNQTKAGRLEVHRRGLWLPVCGDSWSGYAARVACHQMGFKDGRELKVVSKPGDAGDQWVGPITCIGEELRLDTCNIDSWSSSCPGLTPAGVRCIDK